MNPKTIDLIRSNDHLTLSRVISKVESNSNQENDLLKKIYRLSNDAVRIGITGPPGAGKSTLTNQIIKYFLKDNKSVGVIAVDPTSPFTGGALLGDRVGEAVKEGVREKAKRLDVRRWSSKQIQANRHVHTGSTGQKMALDTWRNHSAELEPEWTEIEAARTALFELLDSC